MLERFLVRSINFAGFMNTTERAELVDLARDGLIEHRLARRENALVLLDRGMSCSDIGAVLFLDDDTVRTWYRLYKEEGILGLAGFGYEWPEFSRHPRFSFSAAFRTRRAIATRSSCACASDCRTSRCSRTRPALLRLAFCKSFTVSVPA